MQVHLAANTEKRQEETHLHKFILFPLVNKSLYSVNNSFLLSLEQKGVTLLF